MQQEILYGIVFIGIADKIDPQIGVDFLSCQGDEPGAEFISASYNRLDRLFML